MAEAASKARNHLACLEVVIEMQAVDKFALLVAQNIGQGAAEKFNRSL
jgi:hypothetical protein